MSLHAAAAAEEEKALAYVRLTQHEHVLKRPDTYVGSVQCVSENVWVHHSDSNQVHPAKVDYSPAFLKLVDEILVNAADNKQRHPATTSEIRMRVIASTGEVEISNNGESITIIEHPTYKLHVPEVIFGSLLSGSNFDDQQEKTTGGRNGYGAKLANVFSKRFEIHIVYAGKEYLQLFEDNMYTIHPPVIRDFVLPIGVEDTMPSTRGMPKQEAAHRILHRHDRVTVRFLADFQRLDMPIPSEEAPLHPDVIRMLRRRSMDIAGTMTRFNNAKCPLRVIFEEFATPTGEMVASNEFQFKSFRDYIFCYPSLVDSERLLFMERINDNWEVGVALGNSASLQQLSFVNSIHTMTGGTHVNHVVDQVVKYIQETVCLKKKISKLKPQTIKSFLTVFVNAVVVNPTFGGQTKTALTTPQKDFRPNTCELMKHKCMEKLMSSTKLVGYLTGKYFSEQEQELSKLMTSKQRDPLLDIIKLDDARLAGTSKGYLATLVLTEGDSAFSLFKSAQRIVGSDLWGGLPLKGKIMNVRGAGKMDQIMKNEEIRNLVRVLGLKLGKQYNTEADIKSLRYGHLMIMTDQDHDGSHIKGLIINFLHYFWPGLLKIKGFIKDFQTPLKKLTFKQERGVPAGFQKEYSFFTEKEYQGWLADVPAELLSNYLVKYYKGLGTSTATEACQYFSDMMKHQFVYEFEDEEGKATTDDLIDMAFRQTRSDDRKSWLLNRDPNAELQVTMKPLVEFGESADESTPLAKHITYSNFINSALNDFSTADLLRSVGNLLDGLKPSQRKVLFGCFKRNLKTDIKVAQLAGYIAEHSSYHHGETSLHETIIGMAQNFIGANNIQLLNPSGQFGTRLFGGKDSASPRYIFTRLEKITRALFSAEDDPLLEYLVDDGQQIEPRYYVPVVPTVLINGCTGIGTGWSTFIPQFNPREIIEVTKTFVHELLIQETSNLETALETCFGEFAAPLRLRPWYRGFTGEVSEYDSAKKRFTLYGKIERMDGDCSKFLITELPVGTWTKPYREQLNKWDTRIETEKKKPSVAQTSGGGGGGSGGGDDNRSVISSSDSGDAKFIKDIQENNSSATVHIYVECDEDKLYGSGRLRPDASDEELATFFKLRSFLSMNNMHLFNEQGNIEKFPTVESIFAKFCRVRFALYEKRKVYLLKLLQHEASVAHNKIRFISMAASGEIDLRKRERRELERELAQLGFLAVHDEKDADREEREESAAAGAAAGYDYLLKMPISSLTIQRVQYWKSVSERKERELTDLAGTPVAQLWMQDLKKLEDALTDFEDDQERIRQEVIDCEEAYRGQQKGGAGAGKGKGKNKRKSVDSEIRGGGGFEAKKKVAKKSLVVS